MDTKTRGTLEMALAMGISGTIGWLVVTSGQSIADLLFWRCFFGALTLLGFCVAMRLLVPLTRSQWALCVLGGAAIVLNWVLLFASYGHASVSVATVVYNTQPFMLAGLARIVLGERLRRSDGLWLAGAFAGLVLVASARPGGAQQASSYLAGVLLALGAAFLYAVAALVAKLLRGMPPHLIALVQMLTGCVMLAPWALAGDLPQEAGAWGTFVTIGVVYTGIVYILLYGAYQKLPTPVAGALSFTYPVVAVVVDHLALDVRLQPAQWLGTAIILAAAAGLNFSPRGAATSAPSLAGASGRARAG